MARPPHGQPRPSLPRANAAGDVINLLPTILGLTIAATASRG